LVDQIRAQAAYSKTDDVHATVAENNLPAQIFFRDLGFKAAGGIRTAKQSTEWLALMKEELGLPWMKADLFRFGASGLLNDIERQLEHYATGRYSADYRHPVA